MYLGLFIGFVRAIDFGDRPPIGIVWTTDFTEAKYPLELPGQLVLKTLIIIGFVQMINFGRQSTINKWNCPGNWCLKLSTKWNLGN